MRLVTSRLRFAQPSSLAPSLVFFGNPCGLKYSLSVADSSNPRPTLHSIKNRTAQRPHCRPTSTAASSASLQQNPGEHAGEGNAEFLPTSIKTTRPPSLSYLSHLKRRGHFLPARSNRDSAQRPAEASSAGWGVQQRHGRFMLSAQHYGKWRELIFDYDRLMFESGLIPASLSARKTQRSVNRPEHAADISLWSAIFNFAQRRGDGDGALVVWREIFQRKQLYQVNGVVARAFWQSVAEAALTDEAFLEGTWAYAEWMRDVHGALWPNYYCTIVTYCLGNGEYDRALRWHMRLSHHFAASKRDFFDMLKGFLADPDPGLQDTLRSIYTTSRHRFLYDTIVPLLWSQGRSGLARTWRETLVRHDDRPTSSASRPFLQYLAGYYPETDLCAQEQAIANSRPAQYLSPSPLQPEHRTADLPTNLFHFMNRIHGETFGIQEKSFNDKIGSKWFATSWVSLDTAINLIYGLGIAEIGPLSLQSIALREATPAGVVRRLQQLEQYQIGIGQTNYARAIRHFAKSDDAETLNDLLRSTLHPDVFDDVVLQRYVIGSATFTGDWKTHRLLLAVRLAMSEDAMVAVSNRLLITCVNQKRKGTVLKLLDEFSARGIELLPSTCDTMTRLILADIPHHFNPNAAPDVDFYASLCRRLAILRFPVATEAWQNILCILGRQGRLSDLEKVSLDIVDHYVSLQMATLPKSPSSPSSSAESSVFKVHIADVPGIVGSEAQQGADLSYRLLPRDLPLNHPLHPLSLIFNHNLVESIVRWYFYRRIAYRQGQSVRHNRRAHTKQPAKPSTNGAKNLPCRDFSLAGGIRLLAILRSRGVEIPSASVLSEALVCIAAVFGPQPMVTRYWQPARSNNQLTLREVKELCDAAWVTLEGETRVAATDSSEARVAHAAATGKEQTLLPDIRVLETALETIKPMATSFSSQFTRRGDKKKVSRQAFIDAIANHS